MKREFFSFMLLLPLLLVVSSCNLLFVSGKGPESLTANPTGTIEILSFSSNNEAGAFEYVITNTGKSMINSAVFNLTAVVDITPTDSLDNNFRTVYKTITHTQPLSGGQVYYGKEQIPLSKITEDSASIINNIDVKITNVSRVSGSTTIVDRITVNPTSPGDQSGINFDFNVYYRNIREESINKKQPLAPNSPDYFTPLYCDFFYFVKQRDERAYYFQKYRPQLGTTLNSDQDPGKLRELNTTHSFYAMDTPFKTASHSFGLLKLFTASDGAVPLTFTYEVTNRNAVKIDDYLVHFKASAHDGSSYRAQAGFTLSSGEKTVKAQVISLTSSDLKKLEVEKVESNPNVSRFEKIMTLSLDYDSIILRK